MTRADAKSMLALLRQGDSVQVGPAFVLATVDATGRRAFSIDGRDPMARKRAVEVLTSRANEGKPGHHRARR